MKYKIYCGNDLIHHQDIEELKITNAVVELEQNAIGTFEFDIYPTNPYINNIKDMQSEITVYQDNYLLFKGLACNSQIGYRNKKKVACKQDYFYLTFSAIEPYEFTGTPQELFEKFINEHNSQVDAKHQFKIGECTVTDPNNYITRSNEESQSAWENLQSKLVEMLGGYLRVRYEDDGAYLDYLSDFSTKNVQDVKFGENLLDVTRENTGLDIATVIVPYGAQDEETGKRVTIAEVNNGAIFIEDAEAIAKYGRIRKVVTWDDVTEPSNLLRKAKEWLGANKSKVVGITITAFDLAHTDKDIGSFKMFSYIKVISEFHSLDDLYLPLKMRIDLFNVKNNKIELNTTGKSFTEYQIEESKKYTNVIENIGKIEKNSIKTSYAMYYLSTSSTSLTGGSWQTKPPAWVNGMYYWQKIVTEYSNGTTSESTAVCITGARGSDGKDGQDGANGTNGTNGKDGQDGTDGRGITSTKIEYQVSSNGTTVPTGTWSTTIPSLSENQYMWTRTTVTYTDNTTSVSYSIGKAGSNGTNGENGTDGRGVKSTAITYQAGTSGTTVPTGTWAASIPSVNASQYLWTRTIITYTDDTTSTSYSVGKMGETGNGVASITAQYYVSTSKTTQTGGSWQETTPTWSAGMYLWTRHKIVYTNSNTEYTTPICDSSWEAANDVQKNLENEIVEVRKEVVAAITQSEEKITSEVAERHYTKDESDILVGEVSTQLEQTKNSFNMTFTEIVQSITNVNGTVNANYNELVKYIRFAGGKITLGEVDNPLTLTLANDRMSFIQDGNEVAYISDSRLYITDAEFVNGLNIGRWAIILRPNGNLSFKKI